MLSGRALAGCCLPAPAANNGRGHPDARQPKQKQLLRLLKCVLIAVHRYSAPYDGAGAPHPSAPPPPHPSYTRSTELYFASANRYLSSICVYFPLFLWPSLAPRRRAPPVFGFWGFSWRGMGMAHAQVFGSKHCGVGWGARGSAARGARFASAAHALPSPPLLLRVICVSILSSLIGGPLAAATHPRCTPSDFIKISGF